MRRRSLFAPLTGIAVLVSLLSTILVYAVVRHTMVRENARTLAATIDTDVAGLADIFLTGGTGEVSRRIEDRITLLQSQGETAYYLLEAPDGRKLAGNVTRWPDLDPRISESGAIKADDGTPVFARATQLPGNLKLLVGRSLEQRDDLLGTTALAILAAGAAAAFLSLLAGHYAARRLGRRVEALNRALAAIEEGEIHLRAPGEDLPDEIGNIARHTNRMLAQIERLIAAHRSVSDHLAHELRTPLMHLDARLRTASERTLDPKMIEWLSDAREEIRGITRLLDSLLDIAGAEALKGDLRGLVEISISEIAEGVADLYEGSADELGLRFSRQIAPGVTLRGDPMQMSRLLTNLLDNAFKYVPSGGAVRLCVEHGPRIVVWDNGPGIAPADRERIFDRYWRASPGEQSGHGLGLALARAIAERHHLTIRIEDAAPGSRFILERSA